MKRDNEEKQTVLILHCKINALKKLGRRGITLLLTKETTNRRGGSELKNVIYNYNQHPAYTCHF